MCLLLRAQARKPPFGWSGERKETVQLIGLQRMVEKMHERRAGGPAIEIIDFLIDASADNAAKVRQHIHIRYICKRISVSCAPVAWRRPQ